MKKEIVALNLRLPYDIHSKITELAESNYTSLNSYITQVLNQHIKEIQNNNPSDK